MLQALRATAPNPAPLHPNPAACTSTSNSAPLRPTLRLCSQLYDCAPRAPLTIRSQLCTFYTSTSNPAPWLPALHNTQTPAHQVGNTGAIHNAHAHAWGVRLQRFSRSKPHCGTFVFLGLPGAQLVNMRSMNSTPDVYNCRQFEHFVRFEIVTLMKYISMIKLQNLTFSRYMYSVQLNLPTRQAHLLEISPARSPSPLPLPAKSRPARHVYRISTYPTHAEISLLTREQRLESKLWSRGHPATACLIAEL